MLHAAAAAEAANTPAAAQPATTTQSQHYLLAIFSILILVSVAWLRCTFGCAAATPVTRLQLCLPQQQQQRAI